MPNPLYITNPRNSYLNNLPKPVAMAFAVEFVVFSTGAEVVEVDDTSTAPAEPLAIFAPSIIPLYELSSVPTVAAVCEIEYAKCTEEHIQYINPYQWWNKVKYFFHHW
mgnify:CR=1 FL=1